MFSVLILTLNEEVNIGACLDSVRWCEDIVVLDSCSTDRTRELADGAGVRVFQRRFDDFASQRNYALEQVAFKHGWLFHLDADERFTEPLHKECEQVIGEDRFSGFTVPSKLIFEDRWLKHAGMYPTYQMRLLKLGEIRFVQHGHGQREADAKRGVSKLREPYLHYNFSKGLDDWRRKHERYAQQEAEQSLKSVAGGQWSVGQLFTTDSVARRRALKELSFRLPCRPTLRFLYMYLLRLGFLDGVPGYHYCRLLAFYEYMIVLKMKEIRRRERGLPL